MKRQLARKMAIHCCRQSLRKRPMDLAMVLQRGMAIHRQRVTPMGWAIGKKKIMDCWMVMWSVRQRGIRCEEWPRKQRWMHLVMVLLRGPEMCQHYQVMLRDLAIDTQ